jgi:two-component system NtrC family response regulator
MKPKSILVVDDDESLRRVTQLQLEEAGHPVLAASNGTDALAIIEEDPQALVITDLKMPGLSGMELLNKIRSSHPEITVVMITAFGTVQTAVEAMKAGAYDYITKPIDYEELALVVNRAMERQRLVEEVHSLRTSLDRKYGFESIIGQSKILLQVLEMASGVAQRDSTVLIRGETGTGK